MEKKDIQTSNYEIGLVKLIGKSVKEIHGYDEIVDKAHELTNEEDED